MDIISYNEAARANRRIDTSVAYKDLSNVTEISDTTRDRLLGTGSNEYQNVISIQATVPVNGLCYATYDISNMTFNSIQSVDISASIGKVIAIDEATRSFVYKAHKMSGSDTIFIRIVTDKNTISSSSTVNVVATPSTQPTTSTLPVSNRSYIDNTAIINDAICNIALSTTNNTAQIIGDTSYIGDNTFITNMRVSRSSSIDFLMPVVNTNNNTYTHTTLSLPETYKYIDYNSIATLEYVNPYAMKSACMMEYTGNGETLRDIYTGIGSVSLMDPSNKYGVYCTEIGGSILDSHTGGTLASGKITANTSAIYIHPLDGDETHKTFSSLTGEGCFIHYPGTATDAIDLSSLYKFTDTGFTIGSTLNTEGVRYKVYQILYTELEWGPTSDGRTYIWAYNNATGYGMFTYIGSGNSDHVIPIKTNGDYGILSGKNFRGDADWVTMYGVDKDTNYSINKTTNGNTDSNILTLEDGYALCHSDHTNHNASGSHYWFEYRMQSKYFKVLSYTGSGDSGLSIDITNEHGTSNKVREVTTRCTASGYALTQDTLRNNTYVYTNNTGGESDRSEQFNTLGRDTVVFDTTDKDDNINANVADKTYIMCVTYDTDDIPDTDGDGTFELFNIGFNKRIYSDKLLPVYNASVSMACNESADRCLCVPDREITLVNSKCNSHVLVTTTPIVSNLRVTINNVTATLGTVTVSDDEYIADISSFNLNTLPLFAYINGTLDYLKYDSTTTTYSTVDRTEYRLEVGDSIVLDSTNVVAVTDISITGREVHELVTCNSAVDDGFGRSVAVSGNNVYIGSPLVDGGSTDAGSLYLFDITTYTLDSGHIGNDSDTALFGNAIAATESYIVVGANGYSDSDYTNRGTFCIYAASAMDTPVIMYTNGNSNDDQFLGKCVDIYNSIAISGAPGNDEKADNAGLLVVYDIAESSDSIIYSNSPGADNNFAVSATITSSIIAAGSTNSEYELFEHDGSYITTVSVDKSGFGEILVGHGDKIVTSAARDTNNTGIAYIHDAEGNELTNFQSPNPTEGGDFGYAMAISAEWIVITEPFKTADDTKGKVHVYSYEDYSHVCTFESNMTDIKYSETAFGESVSVDGDTIVVGSSLTGVVSVFHIHNTLDIVFDEVESAPSTLGVYGNDYNIGTVSASASSVHFSDIIIPQSSYIQQKLTIQSTSPISTTIPMYELS